MPPAPGAETHQNLEARTAHALNLPVVAGHNVTVPIILFLRAGMAHGVEAGTTYAVTRWMEEPEGPNPTVRVVVTQVRKTVSVVSLIGSPTLPTTWKTLYAHELAEWKNLEPVKFGYWKYQHTGEVPLTIKRAGHDAEQISVDAAGAYPWPMGCVATLLTRPASQARVVQVAGNAVGLRGLVFKYLPGEVPLKFLPEPDAMQRASEPGVLHIRWDKANGYRLYQKSHTLLSSFGNSEPVGPPTYNLRACLKTAVHIAKYDLLKSFNRSSTGRPLCPCVSISHQDQAFTLEFNQAAWGTDDPTRRSHYANVVVFHFSPGPEYAVRKIYPFDNPFATLEGTGANAKRTFTCNRTGGLMKMVVFLTSVSFDDWQMGPLSHDGHGDATGVQDILELKDMDRSRGLEDLSYLDPKPVAGILNPERLRDFTEEYEPLTHWYHKNLDC